MKIDHLHTLLDNNNGEFDVKGLCHDCQKELCVTVIAKEDGIHIDGGKIYEISVEAFFLKCDACFEKDPMLSDFQETEVYARVVGFLRPLKQFNKAKLAEFKDRKMYKLDKGMINES